MVYLVALDVAPSSVDEEIARVQILEHCGVPGRRCAMGEYFLETHLVILLNLDAEQRVSGFALLVLASEEIDILLEKLSESGDFPAVDLLARYCQHPVVGSIWQISNLVEDAPPVCVAVIEEQLVPGFLSVLQTSVN